MDQNRWQQDQARNNPKRASNKDSAPSHPRPCPITIIIHFNLIDQRMIQTALTVLLMFNLNPKRPYWPSNMWLIYLKACFKIPWFKWALIYLKMEDYVLFAQREVLWFVCLFTHQRHFFVPHQMIDLNLC